MTRKIHYAHKNSRRTACDKIKAGGMAGFGSGYAAIYDDNKRNVTCKDCKRELERMSRRKSYGK